MKTCSKCGENKALTDFYKNPRASDGRRTDCKACVLADRRARYEVDADTLKERAAAYRREHPDRVAAARKARADKDPDDYRRRNRAKHLRKYGLTEESYDTMLAEQGSRCAICRTDDPGRYWVVDHDHVSGTVRGVLCWHCNVGLGHFRDDAAALISAADYVMRSIAPVRH